jgi:hypothetical protein
MIRFEQDLRGAIEQTIREEVRVDIHFDLYDVDRAADAIAGYVEMLESKIKLLEAKLERGDSWAGSVDRQGGSFTNQEIKEANTWR